MRIRLAPRTHERGTLAATALGFSGVVMATGFVVVIGMAVPPIPAAYASACGSGSASGYPSSSPSISASVSASPSACPSDSYSGSGSPSR